MRVTHEFGPFVNEDATILILGSIPSVKSREEGFYYMHPQNRFWKVLSLVYGETLPETIADKKAFLTRHKIALFDVLASCDMNGSSDSSIRNPKPNKLLPLMKKSEIARVFTTGRKAYELYEKYCEAEIGIKAIPLPSTSPLNAATSFETLVEAYQVLRKNPLEVIVEPLISWYLKEKRDLPWRKTEDPYAIWISEIMLQQTRVEAVKRYYTRFLATLPDIFSLATVEEDVLLKLWEGLGYYSRAKNLKKAAIEMVEKYQGKFPTTYKEVLDLPGIGSYTAGAITSFAFHQANPAVDGNVLRVISRILSLKEDISLPFTRLKMEHRVKEILTPENAAILNQALMELGATICLPKEQAKCDKCPLAFCCQAKEEHLVSTLPIKTKKVVQKEVAKTILLLECNGRYAILKRPNKGLLAGLYQFPEIERVDSPDAVLKWCRERGGKAIYIESLKESKHVFTHLTWKMNGFFVRLEEEITNFLWVTKEELENYSIPTAFSYYHPKDNPIYF